MAQQARNLCMASDDWPDKPEYFVCDQDTKFTARNLPPCPMAGNPGRVGILPRDDDSRYIGRYVQ